MAAAGFLLLSEWYFTICLTPYNRKIKNVLSASLNKTFPSSVKMKTLSIMLEPGPIPGSMFVRHPLKG